MSKKIEEILNTGHFADIGMFYGYNSPNSAIMINETPSTVTTIGRILSYCNEVDLDNPFNNFLDKPFLRNTRDKGSELPDGPNGLIDTEFCMKIMNCVDTSVVKSQLGQKASDLAQGGSTVNSITGGTGTASYCYALLRARLADNEIAVYDDTLGALATALLTLFDMPEVVIRRSGFGGDMEKITGRSYLSLCCTTNVCIKAGERAKSDQRIIVMLTTEMKCFQQITDLTAKCLSDHGVNSTISIGGEEKCQRFQQMMDKALLLEGNGYCGLTQNGDMTKWNETCNITQMYLFMLKITEKFSAEEAMISCFFITMLHLKRVHLGSGYPCYLNKKTWRLKVRDAFRIESGELIKLPKGKSMLGQSRLPDFIEESINQIRDFQEYIDSENYFHLSSSMMMGVLNFTSTEVCVAHMNVLTRLMEEKGVKINFADSSDDFVITFSVPSKTAAGIELSRIRRHDGKGSKFNEVNHMIGMSNQFLKSGGFNVSEKKTIFTSPEFMEITSKYFTPHGCHQTCAQEVASVMPACMGPRQDLTAMRKTCLAMLSRGVPPGTVSVCMQSGVEAFRSNYKVDGHLEFPRSEVGKKARKIGVPRNHLPIILGGENPYLASNLVLDELSMKSMHWPLDFSIKMFGSGDNPFLTKEDTDVATYKLEHRRTREQIEIKKGDSYNFQRLTSLVTKRFNDDYNEPMRVLKNIISVIDPLSVIVASNDNRTILRAMDDKILELKGKQKFPPEAKRFKHSIEEVKKDTSSSDDGGVLVDETNALGRSTLADEEMNDILDELGIAIV